MNNEKQIIFIIFEILDSLQNMKKNNDAYFAR